MKRTAPTARIESFAKRAKSSPRALVWFRSDLRTHDQPALLHASHYAKSSEPDSGVIGLYIINRTDWKRHSLGAGKIDLILGSLCALQRRLRSELNIPLLLIELDESYSYAYPLMDLARPYLAADATTGRRTQRQGLAKLSDLMIALVKDLDISGLFYNREYEYDEALRDATIKKRLVLEQDINVFEYDDQCLVRPGHVMTKEGCPYQVFSPFHKLWRERLGAISLKQESAHANAHMLAIDAARLPFLLNEVPERELMHAEFPIDATLLQTIRRDWHVDEAAIQDAVKSFVESPRILNYKATRDMPALVGGTSRLSAYLAVGSLAPVSVLKTLISRFPRLLTGQDGGEGASTYLSELCWREFYRHIMCHFPRVSKGLPFQPGTAGIRWSNNVAAFESWKAGRTGYPIVDASMRQLSGKGWMHNRCRMIVASFLVKDLLIDWRWGERYFSETLVDADLASNNGGWQWSASTGTDAQPYFRIFSPLLQSERFDPRGEFIRKWVPELRALTDHEIHEPYARVKEPKRLSELLRTYPKPIVAHASARLAAIAEFKRAIAEFKESK